MLLGYKHLLSEFHLLDEEPYSWAYFRFKVSSAHNTITLRVGIDAGHDCKNSADYLDRWKNLDIMFGRLRSESPEVCTQVVFGFHKREDMVDFSENVLGQLPSISEHFTVQYSVSSAEEWEDGHWHQASLDSEELQGASSF